MQRAGAVVHSFEPIPELAAQLRKRFADRLTVHQLGISDKKGEFEINAPLIDGQPAYGFASVEQSWPAGQSISHRIETRTLDSFSFENVSLIKIDIEGHEAAALRGAQETLKRCRPALIIEAEERHHPSAVSDVWRLLQPLGYRGSFVSLGRTYDISQFDVGVHQGTFGAPNYVFNFVFQNA
jgi:FkbM family methyltransferase